MSLWHLQNAVTARRALGAVGLALACGCDRSAAPPRVDATARVHDAGLPDVPARDAPAEVPPRDVGPDFVRPTRIVALGIWTPVHVEPRRESHNMGYLRSGAVVEVVDGPHGREGCPVHRDHPEGGWYRVVDGGYVCVGGAMSVPWPTRGFRPPVQPSVDASLPYTYAMNYGRTVMYRRPPTMDDLRQFEPWRFPQADASAASATDDAASNDPAPPPAGAPREAPRDAGPRREDLRLADLAGERRGPMIRRLLTGMYVALDRTVRDTDVGEVYWRTQSGGFIRVGRLSEVRAVPTFRGVELDATQGLPVAWMVSETGWDYTVSPTGRGVSMHRRMPRLTAVTLVPEPDLTLGTQTYYRAADGRAVNARNVRRAVARPPPEGVGPEERWIDVDLDEQVLVAYEGPRPVYATLVSSGRRDEHHPERNFETPAGSFRVEGKHVSVTMDGDTAADGPYSIEDVPWVMYFHASYALHGAFWHNYFGWRMSHGCVNLSPGDARWLFAWALPALPTGWHGVYAGAARPGTRVELRHSRADAAREEGRPAGARGSTRP